MLTQNKRLITIVLAAIALLLIPLIAMQFTSEVNWSPFDFLIAGGLLLGTGLTCEFILRKTRQARLRIALVAGVLVVLALVWAELAVGIFGSPLAGS